LASSANEKSKDGYELSFQVNYLSHYILTLSLLDLIEKVNGRIVNTSSEGNSMFNTDGFDGFKGEKYKGGWNCYTRSKLYQVFFTKTLQNYLNKKNSGASVYSFHPGAVYTKIWGKGFLSNPLFSILLFIFKLRMRTPKEGASNGLFLCASKDALKDKGKYFTSNKVL
jgi:retinol dehydrogenase-12